MTEYTKSRERFLKELKSLFPNSPTLSIEVEVDGISEADFNKLPLPHKDQSLMDGVFRWKSATYGSDNKADTFNSEYL